MIFIFVPDGVRAGIGIAFSSLYGFSVDLFNAPVAAARAPENPVRST